MAAVAIDSLEYAHQLEAVGMPRAQAEAVAKGLTTMFIHNFDSLVTKDYLDTRFTEFGTRITANMDRRFGEVGGRFVHMCLGVRSRFVAFGCGVLGGIEAGIGLECIYIVNLKYDIKITIPMCKAGMWQPACMGEGNLLRLARPQYCPGQIFCPLGNRIAGGGDRIICGHI